MNPARLARCFISAFIFLTCIPSTIAHAASQQKMSLPLVFEENQGQAPHQYRYLSHNNGMEAMFLAEGIDFLFSGRDKSNQHLGMRFIGSTDSLLVTAADPLKSHSNYLLGADTSHWIRGVPNYDRIEYKAIYPGVDLVFYGNDNSLEHDFQVAVGADPSSIIFRLNGAEHVALEPEGDLEIHVGSRTLVLKKPVAYQALADRREPVDAAFALAKDGTVSFRLGKYDVTRPLVIDPVFTFSTYLDGSNSDKAAAVATDSGGNIYVTGYTASTDFPTQNAIQPHMGACDPFLVCDNIFITKLDPSGHTLIYSTYLGGSNQDYGASIAVDSNGDAIVGGISSSPDFPHAGSVPSATYQMCGGCYFVASLKPDGSAFNYAGKIGGEQDIRAVNNGRLAVDSSGNAYLAGVTSAPNFQITPGTLSPTVPGYPSSSMFILKVDPTGSLVYSTIVPGNATPDPADQMINVFLPLSIRADASGQVTVAGTAGVGLPTTGGVVAATFPNAVVDFENSTAGFVLQLNSTASAINFATYVPGTDTLGDMTVDKNGNLYVTGGTNESTLPVTATAYQKSLIPGQNCTCNAGYIVKLNAQGTSILAATYLSGTPSQGNAGTSFSGIALDSHANVFVGGMTGSTDFPLKNPFTSQLEYTTTVSEMVLAEMSPDLSAITFGSFLSSTDGTFPGSTFSALTVDPSDNLVVVGATLASDFPTTVGSFQTQPPPPANPNMGYPHTFISKINMATAAPSVCPSAWSVNFAQTTAGTSSTQTVAITNCGNAPLDFTSVTSSVESITAAQSCGAIAPGASCQVTFTFTPKDDSSVSGAVTFHDNAAISSQMIQVSGQGIAPDLEPTSNPFDLGHLLAGTQGPTVGLVLYNSGNAPLIIGNIVIAGSGFTIAKNGCTGTWTAGSLCIVQLVFSPPTAGALSGSLTINSNDPVHPQLIVALSGTGDGTYGVPAISMVGSGNGVSQQTLQINNGPVTLQVNGSNFYPASIVKVNGAAQPTTFENNGLLQVTVAASSLTTLGELPLTVANPIPGGGESTPITLTPYQTLQIAPSSVVSVPGSNLLYAAIPAYAVTNANTILSIDPTTGTPGTPIPVGNDPRLLAPSDDGKYLYVALFGDQTVQRINLQTQTVERTFPFSPNPFCQGCSILAATDLHAVPGSPEEVVLAQGSMISLYNDSGLVNYVPNTYAQQINPGVSSFAFAGNPLTIYALPFTDVKNSFFTAINIVSSGLSYTPVTGTNFGGNDTTGAQVVSDGTLLYTSAGQVWDSSNQTQVGTFPVTTYNVTSYPNLYSLILDTSLGEIYGIGDQNYGSDSSALTISAYGQWSLSVTGALAFPQVGYPVAGNLVCWGSNGFAFIAAGAGQTDQELYLTRSSALARAQPNPVPVLNTVSPVSAIAGGSALTLTLIGTHFVPAATVAWNGVPLQTTYVGSTQLSAMVPDSDIAQSGTASVTVTNPAPSGGTSSALIFTTTPPISSVSLSASSISFGDIALGGSSSAQSITITNAGAAALSIAGIVASGDFSQTNNCGTTLSVNATCQVSIVFTPTVAGQRTGAVTITDNATGSPQAVSLTGNGTEQATISPGSGGSTTATVSGGMTATYNLTLAGGTGLSGAVSLACTGAPQNASCSITPATLNLTAGGSADFTVTVSTTATKTANLPQRSNIMMAGLGLLSLASAPVLLLLRRKLFVSTRLLCAICAFIVIAVLTGCGGGSQMGGSQPANPAVTPPGTYTLAVTASAGGTTVAQKLTLIVR